MDRLIKVARLILLIIISSLVTDIYSQVDSPPLPYGGNNLMKEFICDEMIYPENAITNKKEGTVKVGFTVMQDGKKTNYRIVESVDPELDKEALRLCKLIMYYPAVRSSKNIIQDVVVPVKFNIKKYERNCKQKGFDEYEAYSVQVDTSLIIYSTKMLSYSPLPVFKDPGMTFSKFIIENMEYPETAFKQNISGEVTLSFVVETSGRISNIEVVKPLGGGCTEEAIDLLKQIRWKPGIYKDQAVRSFMNASISFNLNDNSGHQYLPNNNNTTM